MPVKNDGRDKTIEQLAALKEQRPTLYTPAAGWAFGPAYLLNDEYEGPYGELWAEVHWTEAAAEYIRAEEFRYISPEFDLDYRSEKDDNRIGAALLAIGLTNRPFLNGMAAVEIEGSDNVSEIQVFMTGTWYHLWYGQFSVTLKNLHEIMGNMEEVFRAASPESDHPNTELMVDYNHGSLGWAGPESAKAAGWVRGKKLFVIEKDAPPEEVSKAARSFPSAIAASFPMNLGADPAPVNPPTGEEPTMNDELIRKLLSLGADVAITDEHRTQAETEVERIHAAQSNPAQLELKGANGQTVTVTQDSGDQIVVLSAEEHQTLQAAQQQTQEGVVLTTDEHTQLKRQAAEGSDANKRLKQMETDTKWTFGIDKGRVAPSEKDDLYKVAETDFGLFCSMIDGRPDNFAVSLAAPTGGDPNPNEPDVDEVSAFIAETEATHMAAGKKPHEANSEAMKAARVKFTEAQFAAWKYRKEAA